MAAHAGSSGYAFGRASRLLLVTVRVVRLIEEGTAAVESTRPSAKERGRGRGGERERGRERGREGGREREKEHDHCILLYTQILSYR